MLKQLFKEAIELGHSYDDMGIVFFIEEDKVVKAIVNRYGENVNSYGEDIDYCYETSLDINFFKQILGEYEGILVNINDGTIEPVIDTWDGWTNGAPDVPLK